MIGYALIAALGILGGFSGLAWGWLEQKREADERRRKLNEAIFWSSLMTMSCGREGPRLHYLVSGAFVWWFGPSGSAHLIGVGTPDRFVKIDPA